MLVTTLITFREYKQVVKPQNHPTINNNINIKRSDITYSPLSGERTKRYSNNELGFSFISPVDILIKKTDANNSVKTLETPVILVTTIDNDILFEINKNDFVLCTNNKSCTMNVPTYAGIMPKQCTSDFYSNKKIPATTLSFGDGGWIEKNHIIRLPQTTISININEYEPDYLNSEVANGVISKQEYDKMVGTRQLADLILSSFKVDKGNALPFTCVNQQL